MITRKTCKIVIGQFWRRDWCKFPKRHRLASNQAKMAENGQHIYFFVIPYQNVTRLLEK